MKLIAQLKLRPTPEQAAALLHTLEVANAACNAICETAWQTQIFRQLDLHQHWYKSARGTLGLSSQLTVRGLREEGDA